jgi:hypothetical protein
LATRGGVERAENLWLQQALGEMVVDALLRPVILSVESVFMAGLGTMLFTVASSLCKRLASDDSELAFG